MADHLQRGPNLFGLLVGLKQVEHSLFVILAETEQRAAALLRRNSVAGVRCGFDRHRLGRYRRGRCAVDGTPDDRGLLGPRKLGLLLLMPPKTDEITPVGPQDHRGYEECHHDVRQRLVEDDGDDRKQDRACDGGDRPHGCAEQDHTEKDPEDGHGQRHHARRGSGAGGHALAALPAEEDRVVVPSHCGKRHEHRHQRRADIAGEKHRERPLQRVPYEHGDPQARAEHPKGIGGTRVAAAMLPYVYALEHSPQEDARREGAEQVTQNYQANRHKNRGHAQEYRSSLPSKSITSGIPHIPNVSRS